ncbi:glycosyltransferase [Salipiger marinus]|uniref:glycosyltransferase n=1 Tax=Salipiger marinus TaxID=555512 RepID=UPI001E51966C|nr:glycosyltransferase [Salipiger manganoxidans]MCD1620847.1 putative rhamnosyl transferase [Salipiger manganoxidans]MEB3422006.1 glycosyltransferase [Salipiger manganoxidans]
MQIIGFCRFSYPAEGGFQVEHDRIEDRISYLYATARMEERFRHFETLCLPGLRAQSDPDFLLLVLVGRAMPALWLARLTALLADLPQARIIARDPGPHRQVCQQVINAARDMAQPCLQFRHDDDDAVAVDFVATLREAAQDCAALLARHRLVGFDWQRGYVARPDARGLCAEPCFTPYWGVAQAVAVQPRVTQTIMNFGHAKLPQFMPTVTFADRPMYLRGHNDHNDSRQKKHVRPAPLPRLDAEGEDEIRARFAVDADHIRRVFA